MAIAYIDTSQAPMVDLRFKTAAFMCFFTLILGIIGVPIGIVVALQKSAALNFIINTPLKIVSFVFSIYIFLQLKRLLVERHHLYSMSNLINYIIIIYIYSNVVSFFLSIFQVIVQDPNAGVLFSLILLIPAILLGAIISFIFGFRLLEAKDLASGLYRTYAILYIIGGVCFFTIILFPIGILSAMVSDVVLGIIFLEESKTEAQVEFV